jgi:hypothetical protein
MTQQATQNKHVTKPIADEKDDDFVKVQFNRPSFKFENMTVRDEKNPGRETYTGKPIQGKLVALVDLGEVETDDGEVRPQSAYVLVLEKEAIAYDRSNQKVALKEGDEAFLWRTSQLDQAIAAAAGMSVQDAANGPFIMRLRITPLYREPFTSAKLAERGIKSARMWHYEVAVSPKKLPRIGHTSLGVLVSSPTPAQLGTGAS